MERPAELLRDDDGLTLRRWTAEDVPVVHEVVTDSLDHLSPWMPWAANGYTEWDAAEFVLNSQVEWTRSETFAYAVALPDAGVIGSCTLMTRIGAGGLEIGYWLSARHCGLGFATRAAAMLVQESFRVGADRVEILHDEANVRSGGVPRRLGFTEVDRRPAPEPWASGQVGTHVVWRRLRS